MSAGARSIEARVRARQGDGHFVLIGHVGREETTWTDSVLQEQEWAETLRANIDLLR